MVWVRGGPLGRLTTTLWWWNRPDFCESTWLGPTGYPHSENMRITERYHRVDHDTILYDMTITDPTAYTAPIVGPHRTFRLKKGEEIGEYLCVYTEEHEFTQRIREPATPKPAK